MKQALLGWNKQWEYTRMSIYWKIIHANINIKHQNNRKTRTLRYCKSFNLMATFKLTIEIIFEKNNFFPTSSLERSNNKQPKGKKVTNFPETTNMK